MQTKIIKPNPPVYTKQNPWSETNAEKNNRNLDKETKMWQKHPETKNSNTHSQQRQTQTLQQIKKME